MCRARPPGGLAAFARDEASLTATTLFGPLAAQDDERARQLLAPFAAQIGRARQVRAVLSGPLSAVAMHTLPWAGARLLDAVPVVYALDLPRRAPATAHGRRAVQRGGRSSCCAATRPTCLGRMAGADLLHYVGHARGDGWDGSLALGGERRRGVGDLLGVRGPRLALLGGCEMGLLDPRSHASGMSLAHALLLAGAEAVIATDAVVDDDAAAAVAPALLARIAADESPAAALRELQRTRANAARFRVFVP